MVEVRSGGGVCKDETTRLAISMFFWSFCHSGNMAICWIAEVLLLAFN
jgi:hypothetical protein